MKVALVFMPFGPVNLPSLGMEVLAQAIRQGGHSCMVKYLNLRFVDFVPGQTFVDRYRNLYYLCGRHSFPFNEFLFARELYSDACFAALGVEAADFRSRRDELPPHRRNASFDASAQLTDRDLLRLRDAVPEYLDACLDELSGCDLVGFSSSFHQNVPSLALAHRVKTRWPEVRIALGGANCDGEMGPALHQTHPWIDYTFSGEADLEILNVLDRLAAGATLDRVPGLSYRRDSVSCSNGPAPPVHNLDQVATPSYDEFVGQLQRAGFRDVQPLVLVLESSRGCWWGAKHHCTFCGLNAGGLAFRQKSVDRMMNEFQQVMAHEPDLIAMGDNIMPADYSHTFLDRLAGFEKPVRLFYETKANLKRSTLWRMKRAGIELLQPGIESFDSGVLRLMKKGVRGIQNVRLLRDAREFGIGLSYSVLYGMPGEDPRAYHRVLPQLRNLAHLQPPAAVVRVEYHRFSPYHMDPESFGLTSMRPIDAYHLLYPWDDSVLQRVAYFFDAEYAYSEDPEEYIRPFRSAVDTWRQAFDPEDCLLVHVDAPERFEIFDRRWRNGARYVLEGFARTAYTRLQEEASFASLCQLPDEKLEFEATGLDKLLGLPTLCDDARRRHRDLPEHVYEFDRATFERDGEAILDDWLAKGLVFREDHTYLGLSVAHDWVQTRAFHSTGGPA